jgi:hypothetical protein
MMTDATSAGISLEEPRVSPMRVADPSNLVEVAKKHENVEALVSYVSNTIRETLLGVDHEGLPIRDEAALQEEVRRLVAIAVRNTIKDSITKAVDSVLGIDRSFARVEVKPGSRLYKIIEEEARLALAAFRHDIARVAVEQIRDEFVAERKTPNWGGERTHIGEIAASVFDREIADAVREIASTVARDSIADVIGEEMGKVLPFLKSEIGMRRLGMVVEQWRLGAEGKDKP